MRNKYNLKNLATAFGCNEEKRCTFFCGGFFNVLFCFSVLMVFSTSCGIKKSVNHLPDFQNYNVEIPNVTLINDSTYRYKNNYLTKNKQQLWELYIEGNPLQLGYNNGALSQKLMQNQEKIFFSKVEKLVPSPFKQKILRGFLKWYNRKMYVHIREEDQAEIFGLSQYSSHQYDFIAPRFQRNMYLHGAHDIGHAMQDLAMVGCSSLAVWGEYTEDGELLIGRNFDFYVGDEFAKNKVVSLVKPEVGIPYLAISWPGMVGVVSGMNKEGLTVTINAGKSKIPLAAKTPISLVTREILENAKNIKEAIIIAKKRKVFVSESIMVGSALDKKAVLIEISPKNIGVYEVQNSSKLFCTNHFQSDEYKNDKRNNKQIAESHSEYRFEKLQKLVNANDKLNPESMAKILRDKSGLKGKEIGYGNEKALNQLLAHHAVIFSPEKKLVWVSSNPYQLGEFVCYDLDKIFANNSIQPNNQETTQLNIARDPFLDTEGYKKYEEFRVQTARFDGEEVLSEDFLIQYIALNPNFWKTYYEVGKYQYLQKKYREAKANFELALTKEITTLQDRKSIEKYLNKIKKKSNER